MTNRRIGTSGVIEAAGGLLWREAAGGPMLAVIHRPRYDDWSLPKGWREKGESFAAAALREVAEETNCESRLGPFAGCTSYVLSGVPKVVLYWHMALMHEAPFVVNQETDELRWLSVADALRTLSHAGEQHLVGEAAETLGQLFKGEVDES